MNESTVLLQQAPGHYACRVQVGPHRLAADEPEHLGGTATGPTPVELLLAGLASCTAITVQMYLRRKSWPPLGLEITVQASQTDGRWQMQRLLKPDRALTPEEAEKLLEIAGKCPVHRLLESNAEITTRLA